jgi:hypothetical protein
VHIIRLAGGYVVDPAVFADAAAETARVICDNGAVGEYDANVRKPLASIGCPIINSGGRPSAVGNGPSTS